MTGAEILVQAKLGRTLYPLWLTSAERETLETLAAAEGVSGDKYLRTRIGLVLDPPPSERVRSDALRLAAALVKQRQSVPPELALLAYGGAGIEVSRATESEPLDAVRVEFESHRERYMGQGSRTPAGGWRGIWRQGDTFVGIFRPHLEQVLRDAGHDPRNAIECWKDSKVLIVGKDRLQIDVKIAGAKHRVVAFKKSALGLDPTS